MLGIIYALYPCLAFAYVGPGVGLSLIGLFWVSLSVVGALVLGMIVWPVRMFLKKIFRMTKNGDKAPQDQND